MFTDQSLKSQSLGSTDLAQVQKSKQEGLLAEQTMNLIDLPRAAGEAVDLSVLETLSYQACLFFSTMSFEKGFAADYKTKHSRK